LVQKETTVDKTRGLTLPSLSKGEGNYFLVLADNLNNFSCYYFSATASPFSS
jgi:hypothetical protein